MTEFDPELHRKLWLRIAQHVMESERNVQKAMEVLKDCKQLKIEDILPFFPDFVVIDPFQEHIQQSLELYNEEIQVSAELGCQGVVWQVEVVRTTWPHVRTTWQRVGTSVHLVACVSLARGYLLSFWPLCLL